MNLIQKIEMLESQLITVIKDLEENSKSTKVKEYQKEADENSASSAKERGYNKDIPEDSVDDSTPVLDTIKDIIGENTIKTLDKESVGLAEESEVVEEAVLERTPINILASLK